MYSHLLQGINLASSTLTESSSGLKSFPDRPGILPRPPWCKLVHTPVRTTIQSRELFNQVFNLSAG